MCACVYFTSEEVDEDDGCDQSSVPGECGKGLVTTGCLWVWVGVCMCVCVCVYVCVYISGVRIEMRGMRVLRVTTVWL